MSSDMALMVEELSKRYHVYAKPQDRLKQALMPRAVNVWNRTIGRPRLDPPVYYKEFWALRDVTFGIARGETVGIIGTNGSGKSTLLQMVCGTLEPTSGRVVTTGRIAALLELGAGFDPEFTGRQNVQLNAAIYGLPQEVIAARFDSITAFADIGDFIDRPVKTYSSGMFVRLAFAVIAHVDADILVIDEALAVGDVFFTQKCMRFLRAFKERGTILFVSHDTGAVVNFCDRALWLSNGELREAGPAKEVCEHYLASQYARMQKVDLVPSSTTAAAVPAVEPVSLAEVEKIDMRLAYLNTAGLRNDIKVLDLKPSDHGFGTGGATIELARFTDLKGRELAWVVGGERVRFEMIARAHVPIARAVLGFFIKDRLGQVLFGENTHVTYAHSAVPVESGGTVRATFSFRIPILPPGSYSIDVAIADGTHENHVQLCWLHDATTLQSHAASVAIGLVGVICDEITLESRP